MTWAGRQHPVELLVELVAPIPLAFAVGWATRSLGLSTVEVAVAAVALLVAGFGAIRLADRTAPLHPFGFEPVAIQEGTVPLPELFLEAKDELLELTDPLIEVAPDSRVVRLFARQEPTPGELVERITDYLGERKRPSAAATASIDAVPSDARAALQAALANIRASLR